MECTTSHDEGAKRLRELTLFNVPLSDSQLHIITTNCPSLHSLIFSSCSGVSDAQLVSFVNQVSGKLHHFSMRGSISKYSDPTDIGGCSIGRLCHLTELDISDCPKFGERNFQALGALQNYEVMKFVRARAHSESILIALAPMRRLRVLDISHTESLTPLVLKGLPSSLKELLAPFSKCRCLVSPTR